MDCSGFAAIPTTAIDLPLVQRLQRSPSIGVEEAFGWAKTVAELRKARHRGLPKVDWQLTLAMAACNPVRLPKLLAVTA